MALTTIGWTARRHPLTGTIHPGYTFNPWIGCTVQSPACDRCYAKSLDEKRFSKTLGGATTENPISHWGPGAPRHITSDDNWNAPRKWNKAAGEAGIALAVFCGSLCDWADVEVDDKHRDRLFELIYECPNLDWLMLTKQTANMRRYLMGSMWWCNATPQNVWLGTTTENQEWFDKRIDDLLLTPAYRHFISMEPLLGPVDISRGLRPDPDMQPMLGPRGCACCDGQEHSLSLDWVITGGESNGTKKSDQLESRSSHPDWVHSVATQCWAANVPLFHKQWGDWAPAYELEPQPAAMCVQGMVPERDLGFGEAGRRFQYCVGKTMAGNLLDGYKSEEMPAVRLLAA